MSIDIHTDVVQDTQTMAKSRTVQITVKVDKALLLRADKLTPKLSAERGVEASRSDVLRSALIAGLIALEGAVS
jgi:hypothetical protein